MCSSSSSEYITVASKSRFIYVYSSKTFQKILQYRIHKRIPRCLAIGEDGIVYSSGDDKIIYKYDILTREHKIESKPCDSRILQLINNQNFNLILARTYNNQLLAFNSNTLEQITSINIVKSKIQKLKIQINKSSTTKYSRKLSSTSIIEQDVPEIINTSIISTNDSIEDDEFVNFDLIDPDTIVTIQKYGCIKIFKLTNLEEPLLKSRVKMLSDSDELNIVRMIGKKHILIVSQSLHVSLSILICRFQTWN